MRTWTLTFLCGVLLLQQFSELPSFYWSGFSIVIGIGMLIFRKRRSVYLRLLFAFSLGFSWCLGFAYAHNAWKIDDTIEGKPVAVTGYIASIPDTNLRGTSFLYTIHHLQIDNSSKSVHGLLRLTLRDNKQKLSVGDEWRFNVKLKKTYGTFNPGGFDYEAFAFQDGIKANGYVITKMPYTRVSSHWYHYTIDRIRQYFKAKIALNLKLSNTSQWITALAIGERHDISQEDWQVLRNTGTNHLMAIAGLHIGFMAALAHFLVANLWRRIPRLSLRFPAVQAGAVAALLMALTYSAMAGFSIPTQRACLMLTVFLMASLLRRHIAAWQAWSGAMLCVLLWNPLTVLTESFWLSFGSVALIIYGVGGRLSPGGLWWKWGRIQWVIAVGLLPLSIWLFQQFSLVSFIANSIAIPWVGFIVVPLCFLGTFLLLISAKAGGFVLCLADKILNKLWIILAKLSHLPHVVWYQTVPHHWQWVVALIGIIFLLAPNGFPGRYLGFIWLLPLFFFKYAAPLEGDAWFTLLDVGQGLAVVLQTQYHTLVYDAGPKLSSSYDMGESVVVPFLHAIHAKQVDMLVVSHGDNDHIGGTGAVLAQFPVKQIKTSAPEKLPHAEYCLRGSHWRWDGVDFDFLYPTTQTLELDNDSSCVLRVTVGHRHILLTGDIEKFAEKELVAHAAPQLAADILVAPHHGSKTSGLPSFIESVHPAYVLFATGYRNRYHFPHQVVSTAYQKRGVRAYESAKTGAIQFELNPRQAMELPQLYRKDHHHYWNNPN